MKTCKILLAFSLAVIMVPAGCSKDRIEEKPLNEYASPNDYLNTKKQQEQEYIIDSTGTCPLTGLLGTELCMAKSCLMLPNGDSVYFPYTLKLIELYSPKDMIYAQMPTVASGNILETAGEIRVKTFKNGTELQLRPGCYYSVKMPNTSPQSFMRAFYGIENATFVDWTDDPTSLGITTPNSPAFSDTTGGYANNIVKFGWLNCDVSRASSTNYNLTFVSKTDNLTNVALFIFFPTYKSVMQVYNGVSGNIPSGAQVKIIAIGVRSNGDLYNFYTSQTITASKDIEVTMKATTDAELTTLLDGL